MKKLSITITLSLCAFIMAFNAYGQNAKADHAAQVRHSGEDFGTTCILHDADYNEYSSNECGWQSVSKFAKDGTFMFYRYHDQGQLREGAVLPKHKMEFVEEGTSAFGNHFVLREMVMPSGKYVSSYIERPQGS